MSKGVLGSVVQRMLLALALLCYGCADQSATPAATPSPTIATLSAVARPSPSPGAFATRPPAAPPSSSPAPSAPPPVGTPAQLAATAQSAPFVYLWPAYLPAGMQVSPAESRVLRVGEIGQDGLGVFIVTFTDGAGKLVIGGGATDTLPLTGEQRRIAVGSRPATLTTNGSQHQIVFDVPKGTLFVYSSILSEQELLQVASSLQPIDLPELRKRVGAE